MKLHVIIPNFKCYNTLYYPKLYAFVSTMGMFNKNQRDNAVLLLMFKKSFF